jgi:hypothetical protein
MSRRGKNISSPASKNIVMPGRVGLQLALQTAYPNDTIPDLSHRLNFK